MSPRDIRLARWLKRQGFVHPYRLVRAARRARVSLTTACALISMETGNGKNVYGHDPVSTGGCYTKGGKVTRANYGCYKRHRGPTGRGGMQGVGPSQLTYYSYQDQADRAGGCWHPFYNMAIGFGILREHFNANGHNLQDAFRQYNGSGDAAMAYGRRAIKERARFSAKLRAAGF